MKLFRELKQAMSICTTAVSQYAALAILDGPAELGGGTARGIHPAARRG